MKRTLICATLFFAAFASAAQAAFVTTLVSSQFVTAFGSGSVVGAPDGGGLFLGSTFDPPADLGNIVVQFAIPLFDGPGADLRIIDVANSANETALVAVSANGVTFTNIGSINAVANTIDIGGAFVGAFSFVRLTNTSSLVSIDIDAVEGLNETPEPVTMLSVALGLGLIGWKGRRR